MNPKALGIATVAVVVVVLACVVLLGGDDGADPYEVPRPSGSAIDSPAASPSQVALTPSSPGTISGVVVDGGDPTTSPDGQVGDPGWDSATSTDAPQGPASVRIRCLDGDGNPLAGVNVTARRPSGAPLPAALTGGDGVATIGGLPKGERVEGEARHALFRDSVAWGPVAAGEQAELRFQASPLGTLSGRIVDTQGNSLPEAELVLVDPKQQGESVLDPLAMGLGPDGTFFAEVAAGQYAVSARGPGFSPSDQTYVTVTEGGESSAGDLIVRGHGSLSGTVELPGDLTAVLPVELDLVVETVTGSEKNPVTRVKRHRLAIDASMRWELAEVDPGRVRLRLEVAQAGGNRVGAWEEIGLQPGQRVGDIALGLQEVMVAIRGTVTDDQSLPLEGAEVRCGSRRVTTDRDGNFAIRGLDLGDVFVEVHREGYGVGFQKVEYMGATVQADFTLPRAGAVRGYVLDDEGEPARNVPVQVVERQDDGGVRPHETTTDQAGFFEVTGLAPGDYYVKAGPGNPWDDAGAPSLTLTAGETVELPEILLR